MRSLARRVTIRDIAEKAGVSATTVSNVLNGHKEQVSEATTQRVRELARQMGYRTTSETRQPRRPSRRSRELLGLIVPGFSSHLAPRAVSGAEATAGRLGYQVILHNSNGDESKEVKAVERLAEIGVGGILFLSSSGYRRRDAFDRAVQAEIPCVVVNRFIDPKRALHIVFDNEDATYRLTRHLIGLGHTKIGYLHLPVSGPMKREVFTDRLSGYRRALQDHGLTSNSRWVREGLLGDEPGAAAAAYSLTHEMLRHDERPTALLCGSDTLAVGALRAAKNLQLRIPSDLAVTGFDDRPGSVHLTPPLTTVGLPMQAAGARAAEAVIQAVWKGVSLSGTERMACEVIVRGSSAPI